MKFKVAVAQMDSRVGDLESNLARHMALTDQALKRGANLIVFPELSLTGYSLKDIAWEIALDPERSKPVKALRTKSKKISIALGFVENGPHHGIYNSALLLEDGEVKHIHRKIYPPTYGMFEEGRYFSAGSTVSAFSSKWGRLGILVCEDMWHLSLPYLLAMDGAEVILCPTASPARTSGNRPTLQNAEVNYEQLRSYARLLSTYIIFANRVGVEDGVTFWGGSAVVGPDGSMRSTAKLLTEDLITADIDSEEVRRARRFSRHFLDERPEIVLRSLRRILSSRLSS